MRHTLMKPTIGRVLIGAFVTGAGLVAVSAVSVSPERVSTARQEDRTPPPWQTSCAHGMTELGDPPALGGDFTLCAEVGTTLRFTFQPIVDRGEHWEEPQLLSGSSVTLRDYRLAPDGVASFEVQVGGSGTATFRSRESWSQKYSAMTYVRTITINTPR